MKPGSLSSPSCYLGGQIWLVESPRTNYLNCICKCYCLPPQKLDGFNDPKDYKKARRTLESKVEAEYFSAGVAVSAGALFTSYGVIFQTCAAASRGLQKLEACSVFGVSGLLLSHI